jgi:hypothetical protein
VVTHPAFADWYRRVSIDPKAEDLPKRWQGVTAFVQKSTFANICDLARQFFGLPTKEAQFLAKFRDAFKAADAAFPLRDNGAELQVLAGATLAAHLQFTNGEEISAALVMVCTSFSSHRKPPVPEIVSLAEKMLSDRAAKLRRKDDEQELPEVDLDDVIKNLKNVLSGNNLGVLQGPLIDVLQPLAKAVVDIVGWAEDVQRKQELRGEESDILWWLFSESSRDLRCRFEKLKSPSACFIAGKELADLTRELPGPYAAEAFLDKAINLAHPDISSEIVLSDAVAACPTPWQTQLVGDSNLDAILDLCPIHLAVRRCVEAGGKKAAWATTFATSAGFKSTVRIEPRQLALQMFRERLLIRCSEETENE